MPTIVLELGHKPRLELEYSDENLDNLDDADLAHDANQVLLDIVSSGGYDADEWHRVYDSRIDDEEAVSLEQKAFNDLDDIAVEAELALAALAREDWDDAHEQVDSIKEKADSWEA